MQRWNMPRICLKSPAWMIMDVWILVANSTTDGRSVSMPARPLPPPMPGRPACCGIKPNCCRNGDDLVKSGQHGPRREWVKPNEAKGVILEEDESKSTLLSPWGSLRSLEWPKWEVNAVQMLAIHVNSKAPGVIFSASSNSCAARAKLAPPRPDSSMRWWQKYQITSFQISWRFH